jgi:small GTP-binding protein
MMNSQNAFQGMPEPLNDLVDEVASTITFEEDDELEEPKNEEINVCVLGFSKVGKSNLVASYVYGNNFQFQAEHYETIEDTYRIKADLNGNQVDVNIVEVGGDEWLADARCRQIALADAFVLVYSAGDRTSFERLHEMLDDIRVIKDKKFFPCVLVANKSDLRSNQVCVAKQEGQSLGQQLQAPCIPTSGKTVSDSRAVFDCLLQKCYSFDAQEYCGYFMKAPKTDRKSCYGAKKSTRLRYFALDGASLTWKKKDNAKKVLGSISMQSLTVIEDVNEQEFRLVCRDGTEHYITAKSNDMKREWVRKMRDIMQASTVAT